MHIIKKHLKLKSDCGSDWDSLFLSAACSVSLQIINGTEFNDDFDTALPVYSCTDSGCVMPAELPRRICKNPFFTCPSLVELRQCLM